MPCTFRSPALPWHVDPLSTPHPLSLSIYRGPSTSRLHLGSWDCRLFGSTDSTGPDGVNRHSDFRLRLWCLWLRFLPLPLRLCRTPPSLWLYLDPTGSVSVLRHPGSTSAAGHHSFTLTSRTPGVTPSLSLAPPGFPPPSAPSQCFVPRVLPAKSPPWHLLRLTPLWAFVLTVFWVPTWPPLGSFVLRLASPIVVLQISLPPSSVWFVMAQGCAFWEGEFSDMF